jgi:hypothetical protein
MLKGVLKEWGGQLRRFLQGRGKTHQFLIEHRSDPASFKEGLEVVEIDGLDLRLYAVARTMVDGFQYRPKLGLGVSVEILRLARCCKQLTSSESLGIARRLRQQRVMTPYLEVVLC